jgi:two-component system, NarL family, nitrate/nitrite response regulator NarL
MFRDALRMLLEAEGGFQVVGEAGDGHEALEVVARLSPDVALLDVNMPRLSGIAVLERLADVSPSTRAVLLTGSIDRAGTLDAFRLGARGVLRKEVSTEVLCRCVREVMAGGYWVEHDAVAALVVALQAHAAPPAADDAPPASRLTPREMQIVSAVVVGATNGEIGQDFGLSSQTVKNHLTTIYDKLGVSNRVTLAMYAIHHQLLADVREDTWASVPN